MSSAEIRTDAPRHGRAVERRAEEQVLCAILHASSPFGVYALVSSVIVWMVQRKQSRFVAVQALQAFLFQVVAHLPLLILFSVLFAMVSGLMAQAGIIQPYFLFPVDPVTWVFSWLPFFMLAWACPLGGVWAALQLLRGRTYRYPLLGRWAVRWTTRQTLAVQPIPLRTERSADTTNAEAFLAGIAHLSVLVGFGSVLGPVLWASRRNPSRFITEQVFQAALFQLLTAGLSMGVFVIGWGLQTGLFLSGWFGFGQGNLPPIILQNVGPQLFFLLELCWLPLVIGLQLITWVLAMIGAVSAFRGRAFRYPLIGAWLVRYLNHQ